MKDIKQLIELAHKELRENTGSNMGYEAAYHAIDEAKKLISRYTGKECCFCGKQTEVVFNIKLTAKPVCEACATSIFLQQAKWYSQQSFEPAKNQQL